MESFEQDNERWERAVSGRLAKLRTMPVETGRLAAAMHAQIPQPSRRTRGFRLSIGTVRAVAASVLILGALAAVLFVTTTGRPAMAQAADMARMHDELVAGKAPAIQVDSIDAANRVLAGEHPQVPALPDMPADHVMACCMRSVKDKKVACVLMKREGVPVSMMVARSEDMRLPTAPVTVRNGVAYHVQAVGKLNIVMAERHGRWVCLIAEMPADRLMDVAAQLKF